MFTVRVATFARLIRDGVWEAMFDVSPTGLVEVRSCRSGKRFMVRVR
jgi:hypothetical protein